MAGEHEVEVPLPASHVAPSQARGRVREALSGWPEPVVDDASLMVTELVTNAVRHGEPPVGLAVRVDEDCARVDVHDASSQLPRADPSADSAEGGRGLHIVEALSKRWGAQSIPDDGKRVWFEVHHPG